MCVCVCVCVSGACVGRCGCLLWVSSLRMSVAVNVSLMGKLAVN